MHKTRHVSSHSFDGAEETSGVPPLTPSSSVLGKFPSKKIILEHSAFAILVLGGFVVLPSHLQSYGNAFGFTQVAGNMVKACPFFGTSLRNIVTGI